MTVSLSIIICTRNRADDLRKTLAALSKVEVPTDSPTELIIVDNASTDQTAEVVQTANLPKMNVRCLIEPSKGKGFAYNAALAEAKGEILLFTDDDVRLPVKWISEMIRPIISGQTEAVLGAIKMAPHLERDWMTPYHRSWFTSDTFIKQEEHLNLIGANMAFARTVLNRIPAFDVELGPGRLGFREDSLFSDQMHRASYRIAAVETVVVEHHFDPSRLTRANLLHRVRCEGRSSAYIAYHWQHEVIGRIRCWNRLQHAAWNLRKIRVKAWLSGNAHVIPSEGEMRLIQDVAFHQQYLLESNRPRNYERFGLVKIAGEGVKPACSGA